METERVGYQPAIPGINPKDLHRALTEQKLAKSVLDTSLPHPPVLDRKSVSDITSQTSEHKGPSAYQLALDSAEIYNDWRADPYSFGSVDEVRSFFDIMHLARPVIRERLGETAQFSKPEFGLELVRQETMQYRLRQHRRAPTLAEVAKMRGVELGTRDARSAHQKGSSTTYADLLLMGIAKRPPSPANPRLKALAGVLAALLVSSALAAGILTQLGYIKIFAK